MSNAPSNPGKKSQDRLAKALRENLHRRKAQARARKHSDVAGDAPRARAIDKTGAPGVAGEKPNG